MDDVTAPERLEEAQARVRPGEAVVGKESTVQGLDAAAGRDRHGEPPPTRHGIELFEVAGIQIAVDWSWLVTFLLVLVSLSAGYFPHQHPGHGAGWYWGTGAVATLLFFTSVVIHELAHALVGRRLGQEVRRITLFIFGGMAHLSREPRSAAVEFAIAAVGPMTSLLLGGVFWLIASWLEAMDVGALWVAMCSYLAFINVALAVFNLLPGFPLDGGRMLRSVLWLRSGDLRAATARAADWSSGIALGLMLLGALQILAGSLIGGLWLIFIGAFLRGAAHASYEGVVVEQALSGTIVRDAMIPDPITVVPGDLTVASAVENYFLRYGFGGFPVADDGQITGVLSLGEVKRCPSDQRASRRVREFMCPASDVAISADATVAAALRRMVQSGCSRLLVEDRGRVIGLITQTGITRSVRIKTELG